MRACSCNVTTWRRWAPAAAPSPTHPYPPCPHTSPLLFLQLQRDDLAALGNLLLLLACVGRGAQPSLDYLSAHFTREFCHVVAGLLASAEGALAGWD